MQVQPVVLVTSQRVRQSWPQLVSAVFGVVVGILSIFRASFKVAERLLRRVLYPAPTTEGAPRGDDKLAIEMISLRKLRHVPFRGRFASGAAASGSSTGSSAPAVFEVLNPIAHGTVGVASESGPGRSSGPAETAGTLAAAPS